MGVGLVCGAAAVLFLAAVSTTTPAVELGSSSRAAVFAQAAHSARSWAAQAFASPPPSKSTVQARIVAAASAEAKQHETASTSRQQLLAAAPAKAAPAVNAVQQQQQQLEPTQEPAVNVQEARQPRFRSPAGARPEVPRATSARHTSSFFRDAVSELGAAPSTAALEKASAHDNLSFDAAAKSELAPAPRMSVLRAQAHAAHTTSQQQLAAMTVTPHGRAPAGFSGRQYSLTRESSEGATNSAYDFGRQLARGRPRASLVVHTSAAAAVPVQNTFSAAKNTFSAAKHWQQQQAAKSPRYDSWGIPTGANQGIAVSRSVHVAASRQQQRQKRERGITGLQARSALGSYFSRLVAKAKDERAHPRVSAYFQTRDAARRQSLEQVPAANTPYQGVVVTKHLDAIVVARHAQMSEYNAAEESLGGHALSQAKAAVKHAAHARVARADAAQRAHVMREAREQDAFQKRVDAAEKSIAKLTHKAELAIAAAAKNTASKTEAQLEGRGKAGQGIRQTIKNVDAAAAVSDSSKRAHAPHTAQPQQHQHQQQQHEQHSLAKHRGMTAAEARDDLFSSMDSTFRKTLNQDTNDQNRLHSRMLDPRTRGHQVIHDLDNYARSERQQDLEDEQHLKSPASLSAAVNLKHREQQETLQEEAEYEDALTNALGKSAKGAPPLPLDHSLNH